MIISLLSYIGEKMAKVLFFLSAFNRLKTAGNYLRSIQVLSIDVVAKAVKTHLKIDKEKFQIFLLSNSGRIVLDRYRVIHFQENIDKSSSSEGEIIKQSKCHMF